MSSKKVLRNLLANPQFIELVEDTIEKVIDEKVEERIDPIVSERVTEIVEEISKKHQVSLDLLLRYIPETNVCKGIVTENGQSRGCTFKCGESGYCRFHSRRGQQIQIRQLPSVNSHTHGPEQMYVRGCPACEAVSELRDLTTLIM
jgi:hypothetical protein